MYISVNAWTYVCMRSRIVSLRSARASPSRVISAQTLGQVKVHRADAIVSREVQQDFFFIKQQTEDEILVLLNGIAFELKENFYDIQPSCAATILDVGHQEFPSSRQSTYRSKYEERQIDDFDL